MQNRSGTRIATGLLAIILLAFVWSLPAVAQHAGRGGGGGGRAGGFGHSGQGPGSGGFMARPGVGAGVFAHSFSPMREGIGGARPLTIRRGYARSRWRNPGVWFPPVFFYPFDYDYPRYECVWHRRHIRGRVLSHRHWRARWRWVWRRYCY